jgi:hypothetical protein
MVGLWANGRLVWRSITLAIVLVGCHVSGAIAESIDHASESQTISTTTTQTNTSSEILEVKPDSWEFTTLSSLISRYGCIAGYPDRNYRNQRTLTRYEFAAGLNACLDKINEIISSGLANKVSKEDLAALQRLQEEFAAELAALRGRVDTLEAKTAQLEALQFSKNTKFPGAAILALSGAPDYDSPPKRDSIALEPADINDWSGKAEDFEAIELTITKHGCIANYPFDMDRSTVSRLAFSVILRVCLDYVNEVISSGLAERFSKQDLYSLQNLQEKFQPQLSAWSGHYPLGRNPYDKLPEFIQNLRSPKLESDNRDQEYQALAKILETYECRQYKPASRYDAAMIFRSCLNHIGKINRNTLLASSSREDLLSLFNLLEEYRPDLRNIHRRDSLRRGGFSPNSNLADMVVLNLSISDYAHDAILGLAQRHSCDLDASRVVQIENKEVDPLSFKRLTDSCLQSMKAKISTQQENQLTKEDIYAIFWLRLEFLYST